MSNYKLTFQLKQHTPMIHFQGDQHGATLRATELKPKLDRFIIQKEGLSEFSNGKEQPKSKYENWFIGKDHPALNYQVRVKAPTIDSVKIEKEVSKLPNFFANMGEDYPKTPKYLTKTEELVKLEFLVTNHELKIAIERNISQFFWQTNFGTRQSKGFGSFHLSESKFQSQFFDLTFDIDTRRIRHAPWANQNTLSNELWSENLDLFGALEIFYKSLRSGINRKGSGGVSKFYVKPAIFYYSTLELNRQWDKKSIKEHYLPRDLTKQQIDHDNPDILTFSDQQIPKILIKDVFGLSSSESWKSYRQDVNKRNNDIDRLMSPLLFKPFYQGDGRYKIGIKSFPLNQDFLGAEFDITMGNQNGLQLTVPNSFDWEDFWNFYFKKLPNLQDRLGKNIPNQERTTEFQILSAIDRTIKQVTS